MSKKTIIISTLLLFLVSLYFLISNSIENIARAQNNFNLNTSIYCLNKSLKNNNLMDSIDICVNKQRSLGVTGDMFILRLRDKKIIFDASSDCKVPDKKSYLIKNDICKLFKEPQTCLDVSNLITSNKIKNTYWYFDDSKEYINYRYFKYKNEKYAVVQGSENDEILNYFQRNIFFIILASILLMIEIVFIKK